MAQVDLQIACDDKGVPGSGEIQVWVDRVLLNAGRTDSPEVAVRVVTREEMRALNRRFRGQDKPTNVLSFPAGSIDGLPDESAAPLGDIVVCARVLVDEAAQQSKRLSDHWAHMIVHGMLHLLGYDHESDSDAARMEALEIGLLRQAGIANPYAQPLQEN